MARCSIALGGNLGDVARTFERALDSLSSQSGISVVQVSRLYSTLPVGDSAGQSYINTAASLDTTLGPIELLDRLQTAEARFGRTRELHWGPRTLDLDVILYDQQVIDTPRLRVPHPACWYRRFVLDPLCDIAADVSHPEKRATFGELRSRLLARPLTLGLVGGDQGLRRELAEQLVSSEIQIPERAIGSREPTLLAWLGGSPGFESLPVLPRLDASCENPLEFLRYVLQAALDEPTCIGGS